MKSRVFFLFFAALSMGACNKQEPQPAAAPGPQPAATAPAAESAAAPVVQAPKAITAERIAEIEASGQTGLWSTETEVCAQDVRKGLRTTLVWNVTATGAKRVVVYVIDKNGEERHFGKGAPVDEKLTGPWLKPGITFKIRDHDTAQELGSVVIGEKSC